MKYERRESVEWSHANEDDIRKGEFMRLVPSRAISVAGIKVDDFSNPGLSANVRRD